MEASVTLPHSLMFAGKLSEETILAAMDLCEHASKLPTGEMRCHPDDQPSIASFVNRLSWANKLRGLALISDSKVICGDLEFWAGEVMLGLYIIEAVCPAC